MDTVFITSAEYLEDFKLKLTFDNGVTGVIDFKELLVGAIFEPLRNVEKFKEFSLNKWTIYWDNGADFSPEFLVTKISENQKIAS